MSKKYLSKKDIYAKLILPTIENAGWNKLTQFLEDVYFTNGKMSGNARSTIRGVRKRPNYILNINRIPIANIDAKNNKIGFHSVSNKYSIML